MNIFNIKKGCVKIAGCFIITLLPVFAFCQHRAGTINIVFTSDAHYGITREKFRGDTSVSGHKVNMAMIQQINTLPYLTLPGDNGVGAGEKISAVDYFIETGDISNRMEYPIQTAATSWAQFTHDYLQGVTLKGHDGKPVKFMLAPGNHDISNAIGFPKPLVPATDPTTMVQIYNMMLKPKQPLTNQDYDYTKDKINYSCNIKGIHFLFITLWPDSPSVSGCKKTWLMLMPEHRLSFLLMMNPFAKLSISPTRYHHTS